MQGMGKAINGRGRGEGSGRGDRSGIGVQGMVEVREKWDEGVSDGMGGV